MRPTYRILLAFLSARIAFGLYYIISILQDSKLLRYYPIQRRWSFEVAAGISMDWYGRTGMALLWSIGAAILILAASRWGTLAPWLSKPSTVRAISHSGALVLALDFAYYAYVLWTRDITPPPIPDWYCPR